MPAGTITTIDSRANAAPVALAQQFSGAPLRTPEKRRGAHRIELALFAAALVLYLPAIWWGLPHATGVDRVFAWGSDELGPLQPFRELYSTFFAADPRFNPQYPLFHYCIQALFSAPYMAFLWLTGGLSGPSQVYPYGFRDPVSALAVITVLTRLPSLLMGAAVPVAAFRTASQLWDRRAGALAALLVLPMYPLLYYSRTSNVDVPALFWIATGFVLITASLRSGLTGRRAALLGIVAALATATKDASAFAFLPAGIVVAVAHLRAEGAQSDWRRRARPLLLGLVTGAAVYVVASGLVFSPERFSQHLEWIRGSTAVLVYPATLAGYVGLVRESGMHIVAALGVPTTICALVGIALCAMRRAAGLWLLLPALAILIATILPIHFVNFRYVLVIAYILALFAAYALRVVSDVKPRAAIALLLIAAGWSTLKGADLTFQMVNDSRYAVGRWLDANTRAGDRIGYFGAAQKLPPFAAGITLIHEGQLCTREDWLRQRPDFVLVIPQQHFELVHEWSLAESLYDALDDGSLGYQRVGMIQSRALSARRPVPFVNPPVQLFVRADRVPDVSAANIVRPESRALLEKVERRLGLAPKVPPGLVRNANERTRPLCSAVSS
jgi:hypothetical protein